MSSVKKICKCWVDDNHRRAVEYNIKQEIARGQKWNGHTPITFADIFFGQIQEKCDGCRKDIEFENLVYECVKGESCTR